MIKYGLPNTERTEIVEWRTLLPTDTKRTQKWFIMPDGSKVGNPQVEHFLAAGWVLKVVPEYNSATHKLLDSYTIGVDTATQDVVALTQTELDDNATAKAESAILQIDQACRNHLDKRIHWSASPMIYDKAKQNLPKNKAVKEWTETCWNQYYANKEILLAGGDLTPEMLIYPESPHSIPELMVE